MTNLRSYSYGYMPGKWFVQGYSYNIICRYADYVHYHNQ